MDTNNITFKKAVKSDKELIQGWLKQTHIKKYWDNLTEDLDAYLRGQPTRYEFWICYYDKQPFGLILTSDASESDQPIDHRMSWLEPEGMTLLIDFAIAEKAFLEKGYSAPTLKRFAELQKPPVTALLAEPEVKNEHGVHIYDKAGFAKVATFIRGKGFFKGNPHYLMKIKIL